MYTFINPRWKSGFVEFLWSRMSSDFAISYTNSRQHTGGSKAMPACLLLCRHNSTLLNFFFYPEFLSKSWDFYFTQMTKHLALVVAKQPQNIVIFCVAVEASTACCNPTTILETPLGLHKDSTWPKIISIFKTRIIVARSQSAMVFVMRAVPNILTLLRN